VILKGAFLDSIDEGVLRECLRIMFPECEIEIQLRPPVGGTDQDKGIETGKDGFIP
jgi:hypothetical protein